MKKEFIIVITVVLCIVGLFIVLNGEITPDNIFSDDFNYNTTFINIKNHPVMLINNTSGEQTLISHSDYIGMFS